jgi:cell filamentation protein
MAQNSHIPGTTTPHNFFNEKDYRVLVEKERSLTTARAVQLRERGELGDFSLDHLKSIHKQLFQDVYPWAGEERTIGIRKGASLFDPDGSFDRTFQGVQQNLIKKNFLQGTSKAEFSKGMSEIYLKVNQAHPFLEGNGRATREYLSQLASVAGYVLEYHKVDKKQWTAAAIASFNGDSKPMEEVFNNISQVTRAWVFDNYPRERAVQAAPELKGTFELFDAVRASLAKSDSKDGVERVFKASVGNLSKMLHSGRIPKGTLPVIAPGLAGKVPIKAGIQSLMTGLRF